ncbi:MAG: mechanosensitive ion channel [Acidiferrobacterales bacterium]
MDLTSLLTSLQTTLGELLPRIGGAVIILIIGWLAAVAIRAGIRKSLSMLKLNERVGKSGQLDMNLESGIATGGFWVIILIMLIAVFNTLDLQQVSQPLNALVTRIFEYIPHLIAGGVLLLLAWLLATVVRMIVTRTLGATKLDEKLSTEAGMMAVGDNIGNVVYWLIILLFLPAILGAFQLEGLLAPVQGMVDKILDMLPNIFGAGLLGVVGWFVAKILRDVVTNLLSAAGADKLGERAGLKGTLGISRLVGIIVFIFVFLPLLIAALALLEIESISGPATDMLRLVMNAIPNIFAAAVILALTYYVARFVAQLLSSLLSGVGFDTLPERLGLGQAFAKGMTPSNLVGKIIVFFAMLFAAVEASNRMGFGQVSGLVSTFIEFGGQILLGSVILAIGFWLASLAYQAIVKVSGGNKTAGGIARIAILGLVTAMGLRAMGLADDIVNLAFGLTLGAVAIAVALSFGLGGREAAGKQMEHWFSQLRKRSS